MIRNKILCHDVLTAPWPLPDASVDMIVTSPPYWGKRDYQHPDQIGQELTPEEFVAHMVAVFREGRRVLKDTGTMWLNLGDTYWGGKGQSGAAWQGEHMNSEARNFARKGQTRPQDRTHPSIKPRDLCGIPWETALALRRDGWFLRNDGIWNKPNGLVESVTNRLTVTHEYLFLLAKAYPYYFDQVAIMQPEAAGTILRLNQDLDGQAGSDRVPGKTNGAMKAVAGTRQGLVNKRTVWTITTKGFDGEFCTACRRYYTGTGKRQIKRSTATVDGAEVKVFTCRCGRSDAWVAHFATFPEALITDCVKASTSQHGNCAACGAPWARVVEDEERAADGETDSAYEEGTTSHQLARRRQAARESGQEFARQPRTTGWQPTCACGTTEVVRPIVLDPFMGAGTTAVVALANGRDFVGLELNPDYVDLANHRLNREFGAFFTL